MVAHRHFSLSSCGEEQFQKINSLTGEDLSSLNKQGKGQGWNQHTSKVENNSQVEFKVGQGEEQGLQLDMPGGAMILVQDLSSSHKKLRHIPTTPPVSMLLPSEDDVYKGMSVGKFFITSIFSF